MKIFFAVLAGLFIFSRLGQGQGSTGFSAAPAGGAGGEIPYGGGAGIIEDFVHSVYSGGAGGGGLIGTTGGGTTGGGTTGGGTTGITFPRANVRYRKATGNTI
jgi:hypothetical protein